MMTVIMTAEVYGLFFLLDLASTLCLEHLASFNISAGLSAKGFLEANLDAFRMKPWLVLKDCKKQRFPDRWCCNEQEWNEERENRWKRIIARKGQDVPRDITIITII